jgi:ABC-2 type transport system ATP-binding protein
VIVLEKGRKVYDGETDAGIKFLHYEDTEDDVNSEQETDEELGSDV